ncbi:hypothetical protein SEVIR_9G332300v4 [Setaria viridis]|uniref:Uncharacterized protein n=1 Tax=Setaria viridis TaxID=4556 RepID=A0A4U6T0E1_SETVI|nr:hypothetical protein SEVIR_9G332300v2 [Setaria viridis]
MLNLVGKLVEVNVFLNKALAQNLDLKDGPTNNLVYAAVEKAFPSKEVLYKVTQVIQNMLNNGDFKIDQIAASGEFLVKCSSPADANKLHGKVQVCENTMIGFRKISFVYLQDDLASRLNLNVRDANPDEWKSEVDKEYFETQERGKGPEEGRRKEDSEDQR